MGCEVCGGPCCVEGLRGGGCWMGSVWMRMRVRVRARVGGQRLVVLSGQVRSDGSGIRKSSDGQLSLLDVTVYKVYLPTRTVRRFSITLDGCIHFISYHLDSTSLLVSSISSTLFEFTHLLTCDRPHSKSVPRTVHVHGRSRRRFSKLLMYCTLQALNVQYSTHLHSYLFSSPLLSHDLKNFKVLMVVQL